MGLKGVQMGLAIYHWIAMDISIMTQVKFLAKCKRFKSSFENCFFHTKNVNRIFDRIFKPFIGMRQIIWRWKAAAKPLLPHVESFSNSLCLKSNLKKRKIS